MKYAQGREEANHMSLTKKVLGLIPKALARQMPIYIIDESGAKILRNDILARAFLNKEENIRR